MPNPNDIAHDAEKIADIVCATDTDDRADLFHSVYLILKMKSQNFTAELFDGMAVRHGYY